jgi:uncharacterized protein
MRMDNEQESRNVEDRRGSGLPVSRGVAGGGIGMIILLLAALFFGFDPSVLMGGMSGGGDVPQSQVTQRPVPGQGGQAQRSPADDEMRSFISKVLGSTEHTWNQIFARNGKQYQAPTLVLFTGQVQSACGFAQAASGPFYCGSDQKVYIDLAFYRELRERFKAPGDFAQAYVVAHEIGHHVQNQLGIMQKVQSMQSRVQQEESNQLSVRLELQADCFAGVWAHTAHRDRKILEEGDVEEGLNAAAQIGDDSIMKRTRGYVVPEGFTHGSAAQRQRWFRRGLESGDMRQCDTFSTRQL